MNLLLSLLAFISFFKNLFGIFMNYSLLMQFHQYAKKLLEVPRYNLQRNPIGIDAKMTVIGTLHDNVTVEPKDMKYRVKTFCLS